MGLAGKNGNSVPRMRDGIGTPENGDGKCDGAQAGLPRFTCVTSAKTDLRRTPGLASGML